MRNFAKRGKNTTPIRRGTCLPTPNQTHKTEHNTAFMGEYIVSARKYRPVSFDSVVGQSALTTTLKNAVKSGKLAHAYLFCGPRGVGKTTCARIFAKAINCLTPTEMGEACNHCESCQAFNDQRSYNIFELDAASNNSVENIKTLMDQTRIPPQVGKYKVFIIDEVHMLSTAAFNAFLKTLEEPPAHVIFILATTEKHKILPTILSRCQIYDFERMTVPGIIDHLKRVAENEGIAYEEEALAVIAEKADGGMRDALSIFDQAASFAQGNLTYDSVIADLNVLDSDNYFSIIDLAVQNKVSDIMVLVNDIIAKGFDAGNLVNGLATHVRNVLMAKDESTLPLLEVSARQRERFKEQAQKCPTKFLYKALQVMNQCDIHYRASSNKRLLAELTLIQVAQITQPEDEPAAGRSPKRLKSLFRKLATPQPKPAQQVVGGDKPLVRTTVATRTATALANTNEAKTTPYPTQPAVETPKANEPETTTQRTAMPIGKLKLGKVGTSFADLKRGPEKVGQVKEDEITNKEENHVFSQEELELQWMALCNRMPQEMIAIATRMKNMSPRITQFPNIEVLADNEIVLEEVNNIKKRIEGGLAKYLHNGQLQLHIRLAKVEEMKRILSKKEIYENMLKANPAIDKLRDALGLELA